MSYKAARPTRSRQANAFGGRCDEGAKRLAEQEEKLARRLAGVTNDLGRRLRVRGLTR
jgi:hypothetical protein